MLSHFNFVIEHIYLSGFMKTWLQCFDPPPTELCNYHDNHSQQRPDSAG